MGTILNVVFCILGFVGFYADIYLLLLASFIYYIIETLVGLISGELKNLNTAIVAIIIGVVVAISNDISIFKTIMIALNYESALMTVFSIVYLIYFRLSYKDPMRYLNALRFTDSDDE